MNFWINQDYDTAKDGPHVVGCQNNNTTVLHK